MSRELVDTDHGLFIIDGTPGEYRLCTVTLTEVGTFTRQYEARRSAKFPELYPVTP